MKLKKIITAFLILVLVLQLLPIKQTISYFFGNNSASEELVHIDKGSAKVFKFLDDDNKILSGYLSFSSPVTLIITSFVHPFDETIPVSHAAEIQTPPPNKA